MKYVIITNNPLVESTYGANHSIVKVDGYIDVLKTVRDHVHAGAKLLSHPQAGSIKPYETPFRTVIVSEEKGGLDFDSLHYIESALERFITLSGSMGIREYDERCINDFQVIDEGLIRSAISSMDK